MNDAVIRREAVPKQALLLSLLSLWVPILSSALFPDWTREDVGLLVWLLVLVPGFLLSYYRGWKGGSIALAGGMAALSVAQVVALLTDASLPSADIVLGIVAVLTVVSLGSGVLSSLFHRSIARAQQLALTDPVTGIPNRRHALLELEKAFAAAERGAKLSVVLFDLDHFKRVNDDYGHAEGDRVLLRFAQILQSSSRAMNVTARFGGEEFIAILRSAGSDGARTYAERVRERLRQVELPYGPITASAGVAEYEDGMASPDVIVAAADQALYRAKNAGRDRVVVIGRRGRRSEDVQRPPKPDEEELPRGRGELVLVVDDDVDALRSVARTLRRFGYSVFESPSPSGAVEIARGLSEPLDLVLTDVVMPEMGGFRLVEMLGGIQEEVRVMYMSGYSQEEVDWGGVPGTAYDYLSKPISVHELVRRVRRILDQPISAERRISPADTAPGSDTQAQSDHSLDLSRALEARIAVEGRIHVVHVDENRGQLIVRMLEERGLRASSVPGGLRAIFDGLPHKRADLLVLDLDLGREELESLIDLLGKQAFAPAVLLLTGSKNAHIREVAQRLGWVDSLNKPFAMVELESRVRNLLRTRSYEKWIATVEDEVRGRVAARTAELEEAREEVLRRLAWAAEFRDDLTGYHAERVGVLSGLIARQLGWPSAERVVIEKAAPLHDLGKIAIPDSILKKTGKLTPAEEDVMQSHATIGAQLLSGSRNPILQAAEQIALSHHEWWDGRGYPHGLAREAIPQVGRVVAVADAFDSLTNHRPYRDGVSRDEALSTIRTSAGSQFDPRVAEAFLAVADSGALEEALNLEVVARPDPNVTRSVSS